MRKQYIIPMILGLMSFVKPLPLLAQATPPNPNPPPPGLPIDGSIWLLGLVALVYGVYVFARRNDEAISSNINACPEPSRNTRTTNNSKKNIL